MNTDQQSIPIRIASRENLPPFSSPETDTLDWRRQVDPSDREELAKDIAATAKRMHEVNTENSADDWKFVIEHLRGHGNKGVRSNIRSSIRAEIDKRQIKIRRIPWYQAQRH